MPNEIVGAATAHDAVLAKVRERALYLNMLRQLAERADMRRDVLAGHVADDVVAGLAPLPRTVELYRVARERCALADAMLHLELNGTLPRVQA